MSEEVGKALQSVVERVKQAAARRPKVTVARAAPLQAPLLCRRRSSAARLVMQDQTVQPSDGRLHSSWQHFHNIMGGPPMIAYVWDRHLHNVGLVARVLLPCFKLHLTSELV